MAAVCAWLRSMLRVVSVRPWWRSLTPRGPRRCASMNTPSGIMKLGKQSSACATTKADLWWCRRQLAKASCAACATRSLTIRCVHSHRACLAMAVMSSQYAAVTLMFRFFGPNRLPRHTRIGGCEALPAVLVSRFVSRACGKPWTACVLLQFDVAKERVRLSVRARCGGGF